MSGETAAERQKRLAQALRANLRRRKTQARERAADDRAQDAAAQDENTRRPDKASGAVDPTQT